MLVLYYFLNLRVFHKASKYVQNHTLQNYGVNSTLIHPPMELDRWFKPVPGVERVKNRVMALSWGAWKGYDDIERAVNIVRKDFPDLDFVAVDGLTPQELAKVYSSSGIYVSGSWYEGLGLPVIEAMGCGCAVVTTDSKGIDDFAIDGENCLKVPPRCPEDMAEAILRLLRDSELRAKLGENSLKMAKKLASERNFEKFERVLGLVPRFPIYEEDYSRFSGVDVSDIINKVRFGSEIVSRVSKEYIYELIGAKLDRELYAKFYINHMYPALAMSGPDVLDLGGGLGDFSVQACLWGKNVTYCDLPSEAMDFAQWYFEKHGLDVACFSAEPGKITGKYDLIWSNAVLAHTHNPEEIVSTLPGSLKEGGILYFRVDCTVDEDRYPMHKSGANMPERIEGVLESLPRLHRVESPDSSVRIWKKVHGQNIRGTEDVEAIRKRLLKACRDYRRQNKGTIFSFENLRKVIRHPDKGVRRLSSMIAR